MGGCTNCGGKERCDDRKGRMLSEVGEALARLYPTRRWGAPDDAARFGAGLSAAEGRELAQHLAGALKAAVFYRAGADDEYCDYMDVLCVGRTPCLLEVSEGGSLPPELDGAPIRELYLRVCLSRMARMATVQQVAVHLDLEGQDWVLRELPRAGVYDAPLLPRLQRLVSALVEHDLLSVDFGEISSPPPGYDPGDYPARYGTEPDVVNYLFYPQPSTTRTLRLLALDTDPSVRAAS